MDQLTSIPKAQVSPKELSLHDWLRLWWGFAWRGIMIIAGSALSAGAAGFVTGGVIGLVLVMCGLGVAPFKLPMQILGAGLGLVIGFAFFILWFEWILRSHFGGLCLVLVRVPEHSSQSMVPNGAAV